LEQFWKLFKMRKITLKLSVAIAAFLIGIVGTAFYFIYPTISFKPTGGGGTPAVRNDNGKNDELIKIVVTGRVVDNTGRPIQGAKVHASLGLDLEGAMVVTDAAGRFVAESSSPYWFKVCRPSVRAYAKNYTWEWVHFDCSDWDKGERHFEQTIVLKPRAVELEENRRLWREKGITDYDLTVEFDKSGEFRGPKPVLIKVRNGQTASIEILDEKYKTVPLDEAVKIYGQLDTVEKIFDYIQKALDEKADVSVSYDKNFGYPMKSSTIRIEKGSEQYEWITIQKLEIVTNE
jgi:hypothetical protein